ASLDHLVGSLLKQRWYIKAERLGGLEVNHKFERSRDVVARTDIEKLDSNTKRTARRLGCFPLWRNDWIAHVGEGPGTRHSGKGFLQQLNALAGHLCYERAETGDISARMRKARDDTDPERFTAGRQYHRQRRGR